MNLAPKVTVFIPVYNHVRYGGAAIESILVQDFCNSELLLIDDGSTDGSVEITQGYCRDPRVRLVRNETNLGIPKIRNRGITLARGRNLALLDSDDIAHPSRLGKQVDFPDHHPTYALVGAWTGGMTDRGTFLHTFRLLPVSPGEIRARLLSHCFPAQSSVMIRTAIAREYGYREDYTVSSDYYLWVRLAQRFPFGNLRTVLVRSRMHKERVTREKTHLVKDHCLGIISAQLQELEVTTTQEDLENHFLLLRMQKRQSLPDHDYLAWADGWLQTLQAANCRALGERHTRYWVHASQRRLRCARLWWLLVPKCSRMGSANHPVADGLRLRVGLGTTVNAGEGTAVVGGRDGVDLTH